MTQAASGNVQGFPIFQGAKIAEPNGQISGWFYRFLLSLWFRTGKDFIANVNAAYLQQAATGAGTPIEVRKAADGSLIGVIYIANTPGGAPIPQAPVVSPFQFTAPKDGTLVVESGKVELSRDGGGTWFQTSLAGGALPVLIQDQVRVTWFNAIPLITFFPIGQ